MNNYKPKPNKKKKGEEKHSHSKEMATKYMRSAWVTPLKSKRQGIS